MMPFALTTLASGHFAYDLTRRCRLNEFGLFTLLANKFSRSPYQAIDSTNINININFAGRTTSSERNDHEFYQRGKTSEAGQV